MKALIDSSNGKVLIFCPGPLPVKKQGQIFYKLTSADIALVKANSGAKFTVQNGALNLLEAPPALPARELSKLTIRRRLRDIGKEDEFDSLLDANLQTRRDWDDAISVRTDDPMFTTQAPAFKAALGLTDEEFSALIS